MGRTIGRLTRSARKAINARRKLRAARIVANEQALDLSFLDSPLPAPPAVFNTVIYPPTSPLTEEERNILCEMSSLRKSIEEAQVKRCVARDELERAKFDKKQALDKLEREQKELAGRYSNIIKSRKCTRKSLKDTIKNCSSNIAKMEKKYEKLNKKL